MKDFLKSPQADDFELAYGRLLDEVPWNAEIYLPTDRVSPTDKLTGMRRVSQIHNQRLETLYRPRLQALRNQYSGTKRCFIIGNGPSLNRTDLTQLAGEITFTTNAFFLKLPELDWTPTFHVVEDHLVAEDRASELNSLKGPTKIYPSYLGYCLDEAEDTIFINHRARVSYPFGFDFSTDAAKVTYTGCTVTFTCMQLAFYLGFEEIYLIGVDADYEIPDASDMDESAGTGVIDMACDDPNHFHPDYFGKGYRWHDPQVSEMLEAYREARRVTDETGRRIFNATIGGKLEVFERRDFCEIFPHATRPETFDELSGLPLDEAQRRRRELGNSSVSQRAVNAFSDYPRVLLIDMVPIGGLAATGALKEALFHGWPSSQLMSISAENGSDFSLQGGPVSSYRDCVVFDDAKPVMSICEAFQPDVVLYRPLDDKPFLHAFMMQLMEQIGAPLVTWIMDDWLARLATRDRRTHRKFVADLQRLTSKAAGNIAISFDMKAEMEQRLGAHFDVVANGVDRDAWANRFLRAPGTREELVIRYSGGLSPDMTLSSLVNLARAVETLAKTRPVSFEIRTRDHWLRECGHAFDGFQATSLHVAHPERQAYFDWLCEADILAVAYNFDNASRQYVQYSMANKIPEVLASGRAVLAIGPDDYTSIRHLHRSGGAWVVRDPGPEPILEALRVLEKARRRIGQLGADGREFALANHDIGIERSRFQQILRGAAASKANISAPANDAEIADIIANERKIVDTGTRTRKTASSRSGVSSEMRGARERSHAPSGQRPGSRLLRVIRFYMSWRGILAAVAAIMAGAPAIAAMTGVRSLGFLVGFLPMLAIAVCLFLVGYLYTVLKDHVELIEARLRRLEKEKR